jgi:hypothetical protein
VAGPRWIAGAVTATALVLVLVALARYTSFADRSVLGRWSPTHFALVLVVLGFLGWVLVQTRRRARAATAGAGWAGRLGGAGLLAWSIGFVLDSAEDPATGGRLLDGRVFSSTLPAPVLLEWVAMALLSAALVAFAAKGVASGAGPESWRRRAGRNGLLVAASLLAVVLALEGGLRLASVLAPQVQGFPTRAQAAWVRRFVRLNSLGYRDVEHAVAAAPGVTRVALIGDSVAFGFGIDDPRLRMGDLLQQGLNASATAPRLEVVQGARPDTHTLHHIDFLRRLLVFEPRYVLLVYVFNDIDYVASPGPQPTTPRAALLSRADPVPLLVANSVLAEQVFLRVRRAWYARVWQTLPDPYLDDAVLAEHMKALVQFARLAREAGAEARLVPIDLTVRLGPRNVARYRRFERQARAHGIDVWSLETAFDAHEWPALVVNALDNHPNERAHAIAARAMLERFRAEFGTGGPEVR